MQAMVCEMCGGSNLVKQDGLFVCQNCGTKYSVEEARKLLGTVKIDRSDDLSNLLIAANRALNAKQYQIASGHYEQILRIDPNHCESYIQNMFCAAIQSKATEISTSLTQYHNQFEIVFPMIESEPSSDRKKELLNLICNNTSRLIAGLIPLAELQHSREKTAMALSIFSTKAPAIIPVSFSMNVSSIAATYKALSSSIEKYFPGERDKLHTVYKENYDFLLKYKKHLTRAFVKQELNRLETVMR